MARSLRTGTWRRLLAAGALLVACIALGAFWFAGTETALRWVAARAVEASAGRLALEEVRGSPLRQIRIGRFSFEDGDRRVEGRGLEFEWSLRALVFERTVRIHDLSLQSLTLQPGKASAEPPQLPQTLRLPLQFEVRGANIAALVLVAEGGSHELRGITLSLTNPGAQFHALASALTPWGKGEADLTLADAAPFALSGRAGLTRSEGAHAFALRATLAGTLDAIELAASGSVNGAQAELRAAIAPLLQMPLTHATLRLTGVDATRFGAGLPRTDISAEIELRAQDENALAGRVTLANGLPGTIDASRLPLVAARTTFEGLPAALELKGLQLDFGAAGRFAGGGSLRDRQLRLALDTSAFNLRGIYAKLAATKLAGSLRLDAQDAAQAVFADLREGAYRVRIDAERHGDALEVRQAKVSVAGGELTLSGAMSLARAREFHAEGRLARFDPSRLGDYPAALINGSISASGQLSPKPEATLQFTTTDSRYRGHRVHGGGKTRVSQERIWDSDIALELGSNRLTARGAFGAAGDSMDWRLDGGNLAALAAELSGKLNASGRLEGSIAAPSGTFHVQGHDLAWAGKHRVTEFSADGKIDKGIDGPLALAATLGDYRSDALRIATATLAASGRRSDHEIKLTARNQAIDARAAFAGGWIAGRGWDGRILEFDNRGRYAVALAAPASLVFNGADFSLGPATLKFARGTVRIDELARRGGGLFSAGALSGIDSATLLGLLDRPLAVSSTLAFGGSWKLAATDSVNGEFVLQREQGDLKVLSEPATDLGLSRLALSATVVNDRLTAKLDAAGAVPGAISAQLRTTLARQGEAIGLPGASALSFDAKLDLPSLAWAAPLISEKMVLDGSVKGQIAGLGTVARPQLSGSIDAVGLRIEYPEQGVYLNNGSLHAILKDDNALLLERISLRGGEGTLEGSGTLAWAPDGARAHLALKADKLELLKRLDRLLVLSGNADITLEKQRVRATGALKADRGEIVLPESDGPTLSADVVVLGRDGKAELKDTPLATEIELGLDLGEQFSLKGRGVDARLAGMIKVHAAGGAPARASGSIRVAQGGYSAYGQRLAIERGILNFAGPLDDPGLDIVAMRKQQAVEAGVAIRGTARAPQISLISNPFVPDSEKLSWLILGRGMDGANKTDLGVLQSAAGALLARGESITLQSRIAHAAGLDEFAVSGSGGLESTVLTLGKRLSSRAYLSFEQGLAAATQLVKINYTLTPRLSIRTQTGSESALDAFYTFSFK